MLCQLCSEDFDIYGTGPDAGVTQHSFPSGSERPSGA